MKTNEGTIDRALRVIVGLLLITLAATGTVGVWGWIGVLPLVTGAFGFCPALCHLRHEYLPDEKILIYHSLPRPIDLISVSGIFSSQPVSRPGWMKFM